MLLLWFILTDHPWLHSRCLTWGSSQRCSTQSPQTPEFLHTCDFHSSGDSPSRAKYRPSPLSFLLKCGCFSGLGHKPQLERKTESTQSYFLWMILTRYCRSYIDCMEIYHHSVTLYCQTLLKPKNEEQWSVLFEYSLCVNILQLRWEGGRSWSPLFMKLMKSFITNESVQKYLN